MNLFIEVIGRNFCFVLFESSKGAVPLACIILIEKDFTQAIGKALIHSSKVDLQDLQRSVF
jgi:hypothetical protein